MQAKADLHVHSKYSNRPSEWILRRIGAPECFVEPARIYERCRRNGMTFVTITDHNCIDGCLDIADKPGTFVSSEITTYFPEDRCKVHCLVYDITEQQFTNIQDVRENIYDLRDYLAEQSIVHSIAHPFFAVNDRLTEEHIEKLLVLFNRFEGINGTRHQRANELVRLIFYHLTPDILEELAARHKLAPLGNTPWQKALTAGSDDHSGVYAACAYTSTPESRTVTEFLDHLAWNRHVPDGQSGTSLKFAHSIYHIAYQYYHDRFLLGGNNHTSLLGQLLNKLLANSDIEPPPPRNSLRGLARRAIGSWKAKRLSETEQIFVREYFRADDSARGERIRKRGGGDDEVSFELASRMSQELGYRFLAQFMERVQEGSLSESLQSLASLGPVALSITPYLAAFRTQHKDDALLDTISRRFDGIMKDNSREIRKAWVTDTYSDVNGVTRTIQTLASLAATAGRELTVLTCCEDLPETGELKLKNFEPVGTFSLPEYEELTLAFPPFLEIIEYLERNRFSELIISTPGPLGLISLAAAKLLGLRLTAIYHTDFPKYVEVMTEDEAMGQITWRYMCWFYGQMDTVFAPSQWYRDQLAENGLDPARLRVLPRGVDVEMFSPARRRNDYWKKYGCNGHFKFLYAGRVSREKNLEWLLNAFETLDSRDAKIDLVMVGDGPFLPELRERYANRENVVFTGFLEGEDLTEAYASCDAFVFPSTTDTFGNVVLEAQASGLPVIVSDKGGPPGIVGPSQSGIIVPADNTDELAGAMKRLSTDGELQKTLASKGLENARQCSWHHILDELWESPN